MNKKLSKIIIRVIYITIGSIGITQLTSCQKKANQAITTCPTSGTIIQIAGVSIDSLGVGVPGYWTSSLLGPCSFTPLLQPISGQSCEVYGMSAIANDIVVGGNCTGNDGYNLPGYWRNGNWTNLSLLDPNNGAKKSNYASELLLLDNQVMVVGDLFDSGANLFPGFLINSDNWNLLENTTQNCIASSITSGYLIGATEQPTVLSGGFCTNKETYFSKIGGYWQDSKWTPVTPIDPSKDSKVNRMIIAKGDLYLGGQSDTAGDTGDISVPGYWKNATEWHALEVMNGGHNCQVTTLVMATPGIYASGVCFDSKEIGVAGYWGPDTKWNPLPSYDPRYDCWVSSMTIIGEVPFIAGYCSGEKPTGGNSLIGVAGYWVNGHWVRLPILDENHGSYTTSIVTPTL